VNFIECFYACLSLAGLVGPIVLLSIITGLLFIAYIFDRGYKPLLGAQFGLTGAISVSLASMQCYMSSWVWGYMVLVIGGAVVLTAIRHLNRRRLLSESLGSFPSLSAMEKEFGVTIVVLDTQRVRAVALGGKVYLSVGILEMLEDVELRAVVAHEVFHLTRSPSRILSAILALTSLTFLRLSDEASADAYAARIAGAEAISRALQRLDIVDCDERTAVLLGD
jgi:heat shock protein HtpX